MPNCKSIKDITIFFLMDWSNQIIFNNFKMLTVDLLRQYLNIAEAAEGHPPIAKETSKILTFNLNKYFSPSSRFKFLIYLNSLLTQKPLSAENKFVQPQGQGLCLFTFKSHCCLSEMVWKMAVLQCVSCGCSITTGGVFIPPKAITCVLAHVLESIYQGGRKWKGKHQDNW